jgi:putative flippase GtrA
MARHGSGLRFTLLSGLSFATNFGLTVFLHEVIGVREEIAFAVVLALTTLLNFLVMRHFVYPGCHGNVFTQFGLFTLSSSGFRGLEYSLFLVFHSWLAFPYEIVIVATLLLTFVTKFFYYGSVVFSRRDPSRVPVTCE